MKQLLLIISLSFTFFANAQTGLFTDERDGQQYKTIVINSKKWFRENLRLQTSSSYYPDITKDSTNRKEGNYYSYKELNSLCPKGWHVITTPDWENFISLLLKTKNINEGVFKYDSLIRNDDKNFSINMKGADLLNDTLLQLKPVGWIENRRIKSVSNLSLWIHDPQSNDEKFHLHIGKDGFVRHTHAHHIIDKPKKVRMFPVRCVCDLEQ